MDLLKKYFNGVDGVSKFSKYNYSELYFNNYWRSKKAGTNKDKYSSCLLYIVLFPIFFTISIGIGVYFIYCKYMNHYKENVSKYDYTYNAKNY